MKLPFCWYVNVKGGPLSNEGVYKRDAFLSLLTNAAIYDIRHSIAWPQSVWVCDGIAGAWILCYEPQGLGVRDDIAQQYTSTSVT